MACGFCSNKFDEIKKDIQHDLFVDELREDGNYYEAKIEFGFLDLQTGYYNKKDKFNDEEVLVYTIIARLILPMDFDEDQLKVTIYKVGNDMMYQVDQFTYKHEDNSMGYLIPLPIYEAGTFKVDCEYYEGDVFASGIVEVELIE